MLKYVFNAVLRERRDDLEFFTQHIDKDAIDRLERFVASDFAQIDYTDAIEVLKNCGKSFEFPVSWGIDLSSEHERYLAEEHFKAPVVVKNYPTTTHAHTIDFRHNNKDNLNALFQSVNKAWMSGKGVKFTVKSE